MGWGRMLLLGNWGQQLDIQDNASEIESLKSTLQDNDALDRSQDQRLAKLKQRVLDLELGLATVIRFLAMKQVLTEKELSRLAHLVDAGTEQPKTGEDPWESEAAKILLGGAEQTKP